MSRNLTNTSTVSRASVDLNTSMLNNSIGAPTPKSLPTEITKTPVPIAHLAIPEWVHCEVCKRREQNGANSSRLPLGYCHPCGHILCRDCVMQNATGNTCRYFFIAKKELIPQHVFLFLLCIICAKSTHIYPINGNLPPQIKVLFISRHDLVRVTETQVREQVYKLYSNMYKQLFDVFDYQDTKWNQLMMHRIEYLRQMSKIKKGMIELEETKRMSKELVKILQEQTSYPDHERQQQTLRLCPSARPSSVASSTSLNFGRPQTGHPPSSSVTKAIAMRSSPNPQQYHVPSPEPDKLMTYEQAMIYAHPALKDALRLAHRRKMSSKNSGTITPK